MSLPPSSYPYTNSSLDSYIGTGLNSKLRWLTLERLDKYISEIYFNNINLCKLRFYDTIILINNIKILNEKIKYENFKRYDHVMNVCGNDIFNYIKNREFIDCKIGQTFGPTWSTHWFKIEFIRPLEYYNKEIHLIIDTSTEAMLWSDNGIVLQGFTCSDGSDRRVEYIIPNDINEKIYYIEMACNGMFGASTSGLIGPPDPNRTYTLRKVELGVFNRPAFDLYWDFVTIADMAKHLPEDSIRGNQALKLANHLCNIIDPLDNSTFFDARKLTQEFLNKKNGESQHKITAIGHCHIDTAWLWRYRESHRKCARSWSTQLQLMKEYPDYKFVCSQAQQLEWLRNDYPELFTRLQEAARNGQFIVTGGTWVEMDGNLPSGESFIRQFLYGQKFFKKYFGSNCDIFWLPDTFGYSGQLPQIIRGCDAKYFLTQKLSWNLINKFPKSSFHWVGIDGTPVLTHFPPADNYNASGNVSELIESVKNFKDKGSTNSSLLVFGHGDGGGGPQRDHIERLSRLSDTDGLAKVKFGSPLSFFYDLEKDANKLSKYNGELYFELHRGTYTTQAILKFYNRKLENLFRVVEFLATRVSTLNSKFQYPREIIEDSWKDVLLNQFHDVLPGSCIGSAVADAIQLYEKANTSITSLIKFSKFNNGAENSDLILFNGADVKREEVIELKNSNGTSKIVSCVLEPFSAKLIDSRSEFKFDRTVNAVQTDNCLEMENDLLKLSIANDGRIYSLVHKISNREVICSNSDGGNNFVVFADVPLYWDAWDVELYHLQTRKSVQKASSVKLVENNSLRSVVEVRFDISAKSFITQRIILTAVADYVEFDCNIEWHENHKFLKVEFPVDIKSSYATYEIQFGHLSRPTHTNTTYDLAQFEVAAQRWADLSEYNFGVALINDSKYGYSVHENIMRSPKAPDDFADMGTHNIKFALKPHVGSFQDSGVIETSECFNMPIQYSNISEYNCNTNIALEQLITSSCKSVKIETIKLAEFVNDGFNVVIVRVYEAFGGSVNNLFKLASNVSQAYECNMLEDNLCELKIESNFFKKLFKPFQISTFKLYLPKN